MDNQILDSGFGQTEEDVSLYPTSKGKRFGNYLLDTLFFYVIVAILFYSFGNVDTLVDDDSNSGTLLFYAVFYSSLIGYYTLCEGFLEGKTLAKFITGTRAVRQDGQAMDVPTALKRSFSRIVPFEAFSFLGNTPLGWHDRWTDTMVVDESAYKNAINNSI